MVVSFADGKATVLENGTMVSLVLVATGAEVGAAFTVQVDPTEAVPPSARGGWGRDQRGFVCYLVHMGLKATGFAALD